jgi:hypothetical protein
MNQYSWKEAESTINEKNRYLLSIIRNRRVLGLKNVSLSFRTDEKRKIMHKYPDFAKVPKLSILARCYLLGIPEICEAAAEMQRELYKKDLEFAKENNILLEDYCSNFQYNISFRLYEYEKQLFYMKSIISNPPVVLMRSLYNLNFSSFNWDNVSDELLDELTKGINLIEFLTEKVEFMEEESLYSTES